MHAKARTDPIHINNDKATRVTYFDRCAITGIEPKFEKSNVCMFRNHTLSSVYPFWFPLSRFCCTPVAACPWKSSWHSSCVEPQPRQHAGQDSQAKWAGAWAMSQGIPIPHDFLNSLRANERNILCKEYHQPQGCQNGAFGKRSFCRGDTRHFRHFRRFPGFEERSPFLVLWVECNTRIFATFRQNRLFSAGDKTTVFQNDCFDNSDNLTFMPYEPFLLGMGFWRVFLNLTDTTFNT